MRIRPSHIHFTQDSIKNTFRDGHTLLETALQIVREEVGKRDISSTDISHPGWGREALYA